MSTMMDEWSPDSQRLVLHGLFGAFGSVNSSSDNMPVRMDDAADRAALRNEGQTASERGTGATCQPADGDDDRIMM